MSRKYLFLSICLVFLATLFNCSIVLAENPWEVNVKELRVNRVTPMGQDVPPGRQVVIEFNRPVVPIGKMDRKKEEIPVTIVPELNCEWRWINTSSLACNLDEKNELKRSTKYQFTINPGIKTEDGATIDRPYVHEFITQRSDAKYAWFKTWKSPGMPWITLTLNQSTTKQSVKDHIFLEIDGQGGKVRKGLIVEADPEDYQQPEIIPVPSEKFWLGFGQSQSQKREDDLQNVRGEEARRVWLIKPEQELPLDVSVSLRSEAGLISASGSEKGVMAREIVRFDTFPEFKFIGVGCVTNTREHILTTVSQSSIDLCNPLEEINLVFSAPVQRSQVKKYFEFKPDLAGGRKDYDPWGEDDNEEYLYSRSHAKGDNYQVWLPNGLKAAQDYLVKTRANEEGQLEDIFGRKLDQDVEIVFRTDHRKPNFEIVYHDAVLEKQIESEVPLYVNNLNRAVFHYRSLDSTGSKENGIFTYQIPKVEDIQFAIPFELRKMLDGASGAVYGSLETDPYITKVPEERRLFAQVTPYQVQLKLGHFSSLVWVTDFASGNPVKGAQVSIYRDAFTSLSWPKESLAQGITDIDGVALLPGTEKLDPELTLSRKWRDSDERLFLRVDQGKEMALLPVSEEFLLDQWRISAGTGVYQGNKKQLGHLLAWGTTAQGIYRAGDTIQYKIYVRNQNDKTLIPGPENGYKLEIVDPTGKVVEEIEELELSKFGAFSGEFVVAKQGAVGWYQFRLSREKEIKGKKRKQSWFPMRVLVSDFTPVPFKVSNQLNGDLFQADQEVEVQTSARLHSGGAYTDASVRTTAILESRAFVSKHPLAQGFIFSSFRSGSSSQQVYQKISPLDQKGEFVEKFSLSKLNVIYGKLLVESAVQDDRGKYVAAHSQADYLGVDRLVGLRQTSWLYQAKQPSVVEYLVVDSSGTPVKGTEVKLTIERQVTNAAKVKGAGNAYLTEYTTEWKAVGECQGVSIEAALNCEFTPDQAGFYKVIAEIKDTKGKEHSTEIQLWVVGKDYVLWQDGNDSLLTIIPEKTEYHVGDTARYLIKNPYPGAKALITVERYGVIDHFEQTLEGSTPIFELSIKPDYLPGFYLSVQVFSPRVKPPGEDGQLDLGKPSFKIGYLAVQVKDVYKEMLVTAKTDHQIYKPREKVKLALHAEPRKPTIKPEPIEFAVIVLDESVLDLVAGGEKSFDPYLGFYRLDNLDLRNYSLLSRLIGRQKFEKKGANPGGDGGSDLSLRNLFKFVSYWNPGVVADKAGNANVEFEVPDNLTGWRVLALAVTPGDRLGLGQGSFKVNRPTEIRPLMPNQITEKDNFKAGFSVMNRTNQTRTLEVKIKATGPIDLAQTPGIQTQVLSIEPYKRAMVWMPIQTIPIPALPNIEKMELRFEVTAGDVIDRDGLTVSVPVGKLRSLETAANYGTTLEDLVTESVEFPKEISSDVGGISVVTGPSVLGNLEGAFKYIKNYTYPCWEQKLTKGVMASHYQNLKSYLPQEFSWTGSKKLPEEILNEATNYQAPNGGMCYFGARDSFVDPYLSAYTALGFNWLRHAGYKVPQVVETRLHNYLLNLLHHEVAPGFYTEGMSSTTRAVALAALAENGKVTRDDLLRYKTHLPQMSLFGKTHFMLASMNIPGSEALTKEVAGLILSHANQSAGKFIFNEELDDSFTRILASPLRENCAILGAFAELEKTALGKELVGDVPFKLVRTVTQTRGNRDHWENTQENMFCMNALVDYSKAYESTTPQMSVQAKINKKSFGETQFGSLQDKSVTFSRPIEPTDLGQKVTVEIKRTGKGRLYYATRLSYSPLAESSSPTNAGMELHREYSVERNGKWELLASPLSIKRGELIRVDLYLSLPTAKNFVVVEDPLPGGLEAVNRDLANSSLVDADKGDFQVAGGSWWFKYNDWIGYNVSRWSFYHQELRHDSARFYADYLPAGNYHLSYATQAIAEGEFVVMPSHAEEMYDPDIYGKGVTERLEVGEKTQPPNAGS